MLRRKLLTTDDRGINTKLINTIIGNFKHEKARDINGLSA